jgi:hypothetical protein
MMFLSGDRADQCLCKFLWLLRLWFPLDRRLALWAKFNESSRACFASRRPCYSHAPWSTYTSRRTAKHMRPIFCVIRYMRFILLLARISRFLFHGLKGVLCWLCEPDHSLCIFSLNRTAYAGLFFVVFNLLKSAYVAADILVDPSTFVRHCVPNAQSYIHSLTVFLP